MRSALRSPLVWLAGLVVVVVLVLPLGAMLVRSLRVQEVVTNEGEVFVASGDVLTTKHLVLFNVQADGDLDKTQKRLRRDDVAEVRSVPSLAHYRFVFSDTRTMGLLRNSVVMALGGALLALLLGVPVAWFLTRTTLPGRGLFAALCLGPVVLPPFFVALGGARRLQRFFVDALGVGGADLQLVTSIALFGCVLFPLYVLLVGPALAAVRAGPWEAARLHGGQWARFPSFRWKALRLQGGRWAAFFTVTLPAVLPALIGAFVLAFVMCLTDFAVPDVLSFMLPASGKSLHVYATEVLLQFKQHENEGRAVATAVPFLAVTLLLVLLAFRFLRRSPVFTAGRVSRRRQPVRLPGRRKASYGLTLLGYVLVFSVLGVSLVLPVLGIASWAGTGAETSAAGTTGPPRTVAPGGRLFDFAGALDATPGSRENRDRWLQTAIAAALVALAVAFPLARWAVRGGRWARGLVLAAGTLSLATPGLVLGVGTFLLWLDVPGAWVHESILRSVLVLVGRFLPFALLASWLALRQVRRGHEEAAALSGAGAGIRAWRIWGPPTIGGALAGGLAVLVLSLRELDAVVLLDARILPMDLYNKIHSSRMAHEANLLFLCLAYLLVPALLCAGILALRRRSNR